MSGVNMLRRSRSPRPAPSNESALRSDAFSVSRRPVGRPRQGRASGERSERSLDAAEQTSALRQSERPRLRARVLVPAAIPDHCRASPKRTPEEKWLIVGGASPCLQPFLPTSSPFASLEGLLAL